MVCGLCGLSLSQSQSHSKLVPVGRMDEGWIETGAGRATSAQECERRLGSELQLKRANNNGFKLQRRVTPHVATAATVTLWLSMDEERKKRLGYWKL